MSALVRVDAVKTSQIGKTIMTMAKISHKLGKNRANFECSFMMYPFSN